MEFSKIVLTTDFSTNADAATPFAVEFAKRFNGTLYLLHVFEDLVYYAGTAEDAFAAMTSTQVGWAQLAKQERDAKHKMVVETLASTAQVPVVGIMKHGKPATEIVSYAKEIKANLIVIGTHGHTGVSHYIFGSVAERVVRMSPCPVLTIHPDHRPS
jgi:universal stress protein A